MSLMFAKSRDIRTQGMFIRFEYDSPTHMRC